MAPRLLIAALAAAAHALVAPAHKPLRVSRARAVVVVHQSAAEVSIAASQQLLSLGGVAVAEGIWASTVGGFTVGKALRYVGPALAVTAVFVGSTGSVGSGAAATMGPGLFASTGGCVALLLSYGLRLGETQQGEMPPKEAIGLATVLAFFGFSTALQSIFAAGVLDLPNVPDLPKVDLPFSQNINTPLPDAFPAVTEAPQFAPPPLPEAADAPQFAPPPLPTSD